MKRTLRWDWMAVPLAVVVAAALASTAAATYGRTASHIPGAIYSGTNSAGGKVEFTVSPDGKSLAAVRMTAPPTVLCELYPRSGIEFGGIPIRNHAFDGEFSLGSYEGFFKGRFSGAKSATGSFGVEINAGIFMCDLETWSWSATTTGKVAPICVVPNVKGKPLDAAKRAISRGHCRTGNVRRAYSAKVAENRVIAQQPAPGVKLAANGKVSLVVSRGPRAAQARGTAVMSPRTTASPNKPPTLRTTAGAFTIWKIAVADRFPPGCQQTSLGCQRAEKGYKILILYLKGKGDAVKLLKVKSVYVVGSDGSRTKQFAAGLWGSLGKFVAFTPPANAHRFRLVWPGNQPIFLGK